MKTLLFSGASGFLGRNVKPILEQTYRIGTAGIASGDTYAANLSRMVPSFTKNYDVVLHAAGLAHIQPRNKEDE